MAETCETEKQVLNFYLLDAYEDYNCPGTVYVFGKVWDECSGCYMSSCISVENIERHIYVLPRTKKQSSVKNEHEEDEVELMDVYDEFYSSICPSQKINRFLCRGRNLKYVFNSLAIPKESEYLEIKYSASLPALRPDLCGETFSHVFGTNTSFLELLLLERKIKGPCWLNIGNLQESTNEISNCKMVGSCEPSDITVSNGKMLPPPLVVATIAVRTLSNHATHWNELAMISCVVHSGVVIDGMVGNHDRQQSFCVGTTKLYTTKGTNCNPQDSQSNCPNEPSYEFAVRANVREMLELFKKKIADIDPDIVVGHNIVGHFWDMIIARSFEVNLKNMCDFGRLKLVNERSCDKLKLISFVHTGRLLCDVKIFAEKFMKLKNCDLSSLCQHFLQTEHCSYQELHEADIHTLLSSGAVEQLGTHMIQDGLAIFSVFSTMKLLPLALQITAIMGNTLSHTLMGRLSEGVEFLLLHAFTEKGYVVPDKDIIIEDWLDIDELMVQGCGVNAEDNCFNEQYSKTDDKVPYSGGLVLVPKKGFFDTFVLLMDFNSLYPSIIQEFNICFTTIDFQEVELPEATVLTGVLPAVITQLVETRHKVKQELLSPDLTADQKLYLAVQDTALKLVANSVYGCLGLHSSRFYAHRLAAAITAKGRDILVSTKTSIEDMGHQVIYGDTDSLMIDTKCTDYRKACEIAEKIKAKVNRQYKNVVLEVDAVFQYLLLLEKKKYGALKIQCLQDGTFLKVQDVKGLDIIRSDWCSLAIEGGRYVLNTILSDLQHGDSAQLILKYLSKLRSSLDAGLIPVETFVITKKLNKAPSEYNNQNSLPHVQVALRINNTTGTKLNPGDLVPYIIAQDGKGRSAMMRGYHPQEMKLDSSLLVDVEYYLTHQLVPVITRLCRYIVGLEKEHIDDAVGLCTSTSAVKKQKEDKKSEVQEHLEESEQFRNCDSLTFTCRHCYSMITVNGVYRFEDSCYFLERCVNPNCRVPPADYLPYIQNKLTLTIRNFVSKYYEKWLVCADMGCMYRTQFCAIGMQGKQVFCQGCRKSPVYPEYSPGQLYNQLLYFHYIFDLSQTPDSAGSVISAEVAAAYDQLKVHVNRTLQRSAYNFIDLGSLFSNL